MINLYKELKNRRIGQVNYFRSSNVLIGEMGLICDAANMLNVTACQTIMPKPLNVKLLGTLMDEHYVEDINRELPTINYIAAPAYCAYLTLFPLQKVLELKEFGKVR